MHEIACQHSRPTGSWRPAGGWRIERPRAADRQSVTSLLQYAAPAWTAPSGASVRDRRTTPTVGTPDPSQPPLLDPAVLAAKEPPDQRRGKAATTTACPRHLDRFRHCVPSRSESRLAL